jgi:hypothetical protein
MISPYNLMAQRDIQYLHLMVDLDLETPMYSLYIKTLTNIFYIY